MKISSTLFLASLGISSQVLIASPPEYSDKDVQRLNQATFFCFGGVGYGGRRADSEAAFDAIAKKRESIRLFIAVLEKGSPEAGCYALVALRTDDPKLFAKVSESFIRSAPKGIQTIQGCIISTIATRKVVDSIGAGDYEAEYLKAARSSNDPHDPTP